jgi:hypothetical protein
MPFVRYSFPLLRLPSAFGIAVSPPSSYILRHPIHYVLRSFFSYQRSQTLVTNEANILPF